MLMTSAKQHSADYLNAVPRNISAKYVKVDDQFLPASFEAQLDHPEWPVRAWVTVRVDPERGPVMVGLVVDQPDIARESSAIANSWPCWPRLLMSAKGRS